MTNTYALINTKTQIQIVHSTDWSCRLLLFPFFCILPREKTKQPIIRREYFNNQLLNLYHIRTKLLNTQRHFVSKRKKSIALRDEQVIRYWNEITCSSADAHSNCLFQKKNWSLNEDDVSFFFLYLYLYFCSPIHDYEWSSLFHYSL